MSEKCICNINGYPVKDSTARKGVEDLTNTIENSVKPSITDLESDLVGQDERITALENGAGGGGTKLYKHTMIWTSEKINLTYYSTSPDTAFTSLADMIHPVLRDTDMVVGIAQTGAGEYSIRYYAGATINTMTFKAIEHTVEGV